MHIVYVSVQVYAERMQCVYDVECNVSLYDIIYVTADLWWGKTIFLRPWQTDVALNSSPKTHWLARPLGRGPNSDARR